jgi:hypothetical protein
MAERSHRKGLLIAMAIVVAATAAMALFLIGRIRDDREAAALVTARDTIGLALGIADLQVDIVETERLLAAVQADNAISAARLALESRVGELVLEPDRSLRSRFLRLVEGADTDAAEELLRVWRPAADDSLATAGWVAYLIQKGELEDAREEAWAGAVQYEQDRPSFMRLWYQAHQVDRTFWAPEAITAEPNDRLTRIRALNVATSILLRFEDDHTWGVLKPLQTNWLTSYRGEIAAYRLCPLIHCGISIPHNVDARIRDTDLMTLMGLPDIDAVNAIHRHDSRLVWHEDEDGRWLYGTLKEWVPGFVNFPIEEIEGWRYLVDGSWSARQLRRTPLNQAIADLGAADPQWFERFLRRQSRTDTFEFAHQLSDMHVLDLLINNWDRYSSAYPGSNCQWNHGQLVSIDNGASFHTPEEWTGHEVQLRLRRVRRFSRATIQAIRWMDTEALYPILFPPHPFIEDEPERYEHFRERRRFLLDYVDGLIEASGEERILIFP